MYPVTGIRAIISNGSDSQQQNKQGKNVWVLLTVAGS